MLLLTPFILAYGRFRLPTVTPIIRSRSFTSDKLEEKDFKKGTVHRKAELRLIRVKHEVERGGLCGEIKRCECDRGSIMEMSKDEWAIIGTADETHTKCTRAGQRPDGSQKVYYG